MVYISSSMVFESTNRFPSREEHVAKIPPPVTAYGFSKLSGEWYCKAFAEEFGLKYTICRPFNAYGPNEIPGKEIGYAHVIPDLVKKIDQGQYPLEMLGNGKQTRCFTHVSDLARGIIAVTESKKAENEDFNIADSREITMLELARILWNLCGKKEPFRTRKVESFRYDIKRRVPDVSKIKKLVKWEAKIDLEEGLKEFISWYRERKTK